MPAADNLLRIWAKKKDGSEYPLLFHMLDVAAVAHEMWHSCFHAGVRRQPFDTAVEQVYHWDYQKEPCYRVTNALGREKPLSYNLIEERWIPILRTDGRPGRVGIKEALTQADRIRCIYSASPLDIFAVHRFLLTLLYWKADLVGGVEKVRSALLKGELPSDVLNGIKKEAHRFDLFGEQSPFLQDSSASNTREKEKKSVGSLFAELATGTNIAHFHHGDDENMRLCLPCATLGLLRVVPWTQSGGSGLTPSVHNAPPIMAMATGDNLAITVGLNLVPLDTKAGKAQWSGHFKPTDPSGPIPYLEALTWNPRRILLPPAQEGTCCYCGDSNVPTVGKIVYMKNENTKKRPDERLFEWQDPAAFYAPYDGSKKYNKDKNAPYKTVKSSREELAAVGRDLPDPAKSRLPTVFAQNRDHQSWLLIVPCTNPANNKTFDHRQVGLTNLSPVTFRTPLPATRLPGRQGLDGWKEPERVERKGIEHFVQAAVKLLTHADWAALSNAAYCEMHDSPAAFDVLSGLYWGLGDKKITGLPSRNAAWLVLKLMAAVPARARVLHPKADFCPHLSLPKRQPSERDRASPYPVSFPRGRRLEAALRGTLVGNLRKRNPEPVDWTGLCHGLDQLIEWDLRKEKHYVCTDSYAPKHAPGQLEPR
ncbi:MAG: type I-E CRISPR-associated protein Cse1/CasA [Chloroflexi bacterium]|nr:type I-E CRISPR-associated protein Cse1/CasA [Chloroflexota bacterium]